MGAPLMISSFLVVAAMAQGTLAAPAETAAATSGTLVGCAFVEEGSTEERPSWSGFSIFLPHDREGGPVDVSLIRDPEGIFGQSGFETVELGMGWLTLSGRNSLRLIDTGGGIYRARVETGTRRAPPNHITCQLGQFDSQVAAFEFFDEVVRGLNDPAS